MGKLVIMMAVGSVSVLFLCSGFRGLETLGSIHR